ncbi:MAG: peptidylprolyl isomerase [Planctomycetes bacterium]|nr:peptidylprolyl isomerase [Planctomycetota bacterium]
MKTFAMILLLCTLVGCAGNPSATGNSGTKEIEVETLRKDIKEVAARPEHKEAQITVQHLLVAHKGAGIGGVTRSIDDAEKLTAKLWKEIKGGAEFDAMVKEHTDDAHPGIYGMVLSGPGDTGNNLYPRKGMVAAFGDVGWRLKVGEYGVAPFDSTKSPYGWHIIKRVK